MHTENLEHQLAGKMAQLCSRTEQCTADIRKKLKEAGADDEMADRIVSHLQKEKFLDDVRYAKAYANDKFKFNKWGRIKIRHYMKMKNLPDTAIEEGLAAIDEKQYLKLLIKTINDKAKTIKKGSRFEKMGQIIRFTQSRGFEPELIHRHLDIP